jgi:hypothetical protein
MTADLNCLDGDIFAEGDNKDNEDNKDSEDSEITYR